MALFFPLRMVIVIVTTLLKREIGNFRPGAISLTITTKTMILTLCIFSRLRR